MKKLAMFCLAVLMSATAFATVTEPVVGKFRIENQGPSKYATGACFLLSQNIGNCAGSLNGKTMVELTVCDQAEADAGAALPFTTCTAAQVSAERCMPEWDTSVVIMTPGACAKVLDWYSKSVIKVVGQNGMAAIEKQRAPAPGDDTGVIEDP